jgi:hypothetical protein
MKKHYFFKFVLFLIPCAALVLMSNSSGKDGGYSGSPGDNGNSCNACHSGGNFNASASITTNIPVTGYELNTAYDITLTASSSSSSKHGFQLTAEKNTNNSKVGSFAAGTGSQVVNGGTHITHTAAGNNRKTWSFSWTSPATDEGRVQFYAALNATNGNGGTSGDQVVTATSGNVSSLSIDPVKRLEFTMYPNPATDVLNIHLPSGNEGAAVQVYDAVGRLVLSKKVSANNHEMYVSDLSKGTYIVRVLTEDKIGAQALIKE